jgi:hypothetical protein
MFREQLLGACTSLILLSAAFRRRAQLACAASQYRSHIRLLLVTLTAYTILYTCGTDALYCLSVVLVLCYCVCCTATATR